MRHIIHYIKTNPLILLPVVLGFILHMAVIMPSGSSYCAKDTCGLFFWGVHAHDAIWHLAVSSVSFTHIPALFPTFAGQNLSGYNSFLDFILFIGSKIGIPATISFFKIVPLLWFVGFTAVIIYLARKIKDNQVFVALMLFMVYFTGSFSYFLSLWHTHTIWGSGGLLSMQSAQMLTNVQYAISLILLMGILAIMKMSSFSLKSVLILSGLVMLTLGFKLYGGVLSVILVGSYLLSMMILKKKMIQGLGYLLILAFCTGIAILVFYNPGGTKGAPLVFDPLATVHPIIEEKGLFYLKDMVNARYYLEAAHSYGPRFIYIEVVTLALYIFFNFGIRIIGMGYMKWKLLTRKISVFELCIFLTVIASIILATFFVQKGVWWNTVQFLYYGLFLSTIFTAQALYALIKKGTWGIILATIVILFSLPTTIDSFSTFFTYPAGGYVSSQELQGLSFLKKQPKGVVYAPLYTSQVKRSFGPPIPLSAYDDTSYISAFSGQQTYIADRVQLDLLSINYQDRVKKIEAGDCSILKDITYIYYPTFKTTDKILECIDNDHSQYSSIFHNKEVTIYRKIK